jgi:hypothetical protein
MWRTPLISLSQPWRYLVRALFILLVGTCAAATFLILALLQNITFAVNTVTEPVRSSFPLGVDPVRQLIVERPEVYEFRESVSFAQPQQRSWDHLLDRIIGVFAQSEWLQNMALSSSRVLVIYAGERHEEVAVTFGSILGWSSEEQRRFVDLVHAAYPSLPEGSFLPGKYVVPRAAEPELVAQVLIDSFAREVVNRYPDAVQAVVPLETAITIASLLEREAYDFTDMREISGVIWNRLFAEMPLQLDATLQYVRGADTPSTWWPVPRAADKWLDSPFNTYQNDGLPPHAIANPSIEAVLAALNPVETDCIFYIHAPGGAFYCAATYAEHRANIDRYLR